MGHMYSGDSNSGLRWSLQVLNLLFCRQFITQAPGSLESLDVVFQGIMSRLGGLHRTAYPPLSTDSYLNTGISTFGLLGTKTYQESISNYMSTFNRAEIFRRM